MEKKKTTFHLKAENYKKVRILAAKEGITNSSFINSLIEKEYEQAHGENSSALR